MTNIVPQFGVGTFRLTGQTVIDSVKTALGVGYRAVDTAQIYGNEAEVGQAIAESHIHRDDLFITTKIWTFSIYGQNQWDAILDATVRRFRPIILTALAAVLAMIPLSRSIFFGPMAVAIMGGLIIATLLTLFFLPALYATWFKIKKTTENT